MPSTVDTDRTLRIGEVAERTGTTARTIRYYEEIGLLPAPSGHEKGRHRTYTDADVERLRELLRLRDLLGVGLDELRELVEREEARAALRREWAEATDPAEKARILDDAARHADRQLELVRRRRAALAELEREVRARRERIEEQRRSL